MFDHIGFRVRDLMRARRFYDGILPVLGLTSIDNGAGSFLIAKSANELLPFVWVGVSEPTFWTPDHRPSASPIHLAFPVPYEAVVDTFHAAGLSHGGRDNGPPGPRGADAARYYAAFVLDPDGNNIEACFRG